MLRTSWSHRSLLTSASSSTEPSTKVARGSTAQRKPVADIPATVFLTTGQIGSGEEFWWDELTRIVLCRVEPLSTSLMVEDQHLQIDLPPIDPEMEPRAGSAWLKIAARLYGGTSYAGASPAVAPMFPPACRLAPQQ
jgi:hypothetical protein